MAIRNLDYECYRDAVRRQREHQEDWLSKGYAPLGFYLKDFCLLRHRDEYHLFHIAGTPGVSCCLPGNEIWFGHATTADFLHWQTHEPCFYIEPGSWDGGHVFAPFVLERDGKFWMFYTGCQIDNTQRIGAAVSDDLFAWQRIRDNPIIHPEKYGWAFCPTTGGSACRDAHVLRIEDTYYLYYTAVTKSGQSCVACASSSDLDVWEDRGPVYVFPGTAHCESSHVQQIDGGFVLFFGGHHEYWSYVISDNHLQWPSQQPAPLAKGVTAMEVVERLEQRWLVAYFRMDCYRLFLAIIDWRQGKPQWRAVDDPEAIAPFLTAQ